MGRGQLVFKGEEKSKKKKSKTKHSKKDPPEQEVAVATAEGNSRLPQDHLAAHAGSTSEAASQPETTPQILTPPGEITTSGTVVTGYDTRFTRDLSVGDALIVTIAGHYETVRYLTQSKQCLFGKRCGTDKFSIDKETKECCAGCTERATGLADCQKRRSAAGVWNIRHDGRVGLPRKDRARIVPD
jgi:hypothetical protein